MSLVPRVLLYAMCLFLVMIVYTGQKHASAADTARAATGLTAKLLMWSAIGFAVMIWADTVPLSRFGILVTVAMLVAVIATFTILPACEKRCEE